MVTNTTVQFGVLSTRATRDCMVIMGQWDEGSTRVGGRVHQMENFKPNAINISLGKK